MELVGPKGLFFGTALILMLVALITRYRITHHASAVSVEEQEHFVTTLPDSTHVLVEIDPRNEEFTENPELTEEEEQEEKGEEDERAA